MAIFFDTNSWNGAGSIAGAAAASSVGGGSSSKSSANYNPSPAVASGGSSSNSVVKVANDLIDAITNVGAPSSNNTGKTVQTVSQSLPDVSPSYNQIIASPDYTDVLERMLQISQANTAKEQEFAQAQMDFQKEQNAKAMSFSASEAQKNRDWQELMSNTAHQREVADMIKAGINPVLSVTGGNGATVTSGATGQGFTSAGAKGSVDTGVTTALASMFGALINAYSMENVARISANSAQAVAGINAASAMNVQESRNQQERYIYQNYPNNLYRGVSSLLNVNDIGEKIKDIFTLNDKQFLNKYVR